MKTILISLVLTLSNAAVAGEKILSQKTVQLRVPVSAETLKLSAAGYSRPLVKVLVADLADVTILDHRNAGEGAPCLSTTDTPNPDDVIQNNPRVEKARFTITLKKSTFLDETTGVCSVTLIEDIKGTVRGFSFVHVRDIAAPDRVAADCR